VCWLCKNEFIEAKCVRCKKLVALDKKNPSNPVTVVTLGIVPEAHKFYRGFVPLIHEVWVFCETCRRANLALGGIYDIYYNSAESRLGREEFRLLATVPGGSPVDPERGHFISVAEYLPGRIGRAFEVQVGAKSFRRLLDRRQTDVSSSVYWTIFHGRAKPIGFDPPPPDRCEPVG
jgi:hypothetical protein